MSVLYLNLKGEYFDDIKSGKKPFEYREYNDYWKKRLVNRRYDKIVLMRGYPKKTDTKRRIERPYIGYIVDTINHKHFGDKPTKVFCIYVNHTPEF